MPKSSRHKSHKHSKHSSKEAKEYPKDVKEYSESDEDIKTRDVSKEGSKRKDHPSQSNGVVVEEYTSSKRRREKEKGDVSAVSDRWSGGGAIESETKRESERKLKSKSVGEKKEESKDGSKTESKRKHDMEHAKKEVELGKDYKVSKDKVRLVEKEGEKKRERERERERKAKECLQEAEDEVVDIGDAMILPAVVFRDEKEGKLGRENNVCPVHEERVQEPEKEIEKRRKKREVSFDKDKYQNDVKGSDDKYVSSRGERMKDGKYKDEKYKDVTCEGKHLEDVNREARYRDEKYAGEVDKYQTDVKGSEDKYVSLRGERIKDEKYKDAAYGDKHLEAVNREARYRDEKYARDDEKYPNDVKGSEDKYVSSRGERIKDEQYKDVAYGDKHLEDVNREARYKDEKYAQDVDRERRYRDAKYRESSDKVKHSDDKYREDVDSDKRPRDDKYREDGDRDMKYRDDGDRDTKYRDVKYREDGDRDTKYRDAKYRGDGDKDAKYRDVKYHEDGDRDTKYRDAKYREVDKDYRRMVDKYHEDGYRDDKQRDNWYREDYRRDSTIREEMQRDDIVKDKRLREQDETNDNSDPKHSRDGTEGAEFRHKRLINRDGSPNFDDQGARYKDDRGKRRISDKQEHSDARYRSNKEHCIDMEKKSTSVRVELVGPRGRSNLRDAGMVISPNNVRRGDSPSYRLLKQEEPRYREYTHGVRERRDVTPNKEYTSVSVATEIVSRNEKSLPKDDKQGDDVSTDRRSKDVQVSPLHIVDKPPSTASNDRRNLRGTESRSLDVQESHDRNNKVNRELPENIPRDEICHLDTENLSSASPFTRPSNFNNNNRSLSQTPFRGGPDRPFDDDNNRNKYNRHRRMDSNMERSSQGNNWRGVSNWPSQVANGFVPFQHGPPPLGFHPVMPQFSSPPMFNVRPSMEMNQSRVPFRHNPMFGDDPHIYGRLDWDHSRGLNRGWENSRDTWKVQNPSVSVELSAVAPKDDTKQPSGEVESAEIGDLSDVVERKPAESLKAIAEVMSESKIRDDAYYSRAYLSMLDISEDLSRFELYSQYSNLVGVDQNADSVEDDSWLLIMEEDIDALGQDSKKSPNVSLFSAMNDSIFQRAKSMYTKLTKEAMSMRQNKVSFPTPENTESALPSVSNDEESPMVVIPTRQKEAEIAVSDSSKVKIEGDLLNDGGVKSEPTTFLKEVKREIEDDIIKDKSLSLKTAIMDSTNSKGNKGHNLIDGKFAPLPFSGTSVEVLSEGVNKSGSVNLSRIQSPESTH